MKTDQRILKTKQAVEDAFISLVELKGYNNVTLVDIAKKARVNRNTIYLHYESKEQIISSILYSSFEKEIEGFNVSQILKLRNNRFKMEAFINAFFVVIDKNNELYRILLLEDQLVGYFNIAIKKIRKDLYSNVKQTTKNEVLLDYFLFGLFGIISNYTIYAKGTVKENVKIIADLAMATLRKIQY